MAVATKVAYRTDPKELLSDIVKSSVVDIDLETTGLDPNRDRIGVVICRSNGNTYLLRDVPSWLPLVMQDGDTQKRFFNAKFDLSFLIAQAGISHTRNVRCLYNEELMVSTDRRGVKHDLQTTLSRRLGVHIEKSIDHSQVDWTGSLSPEMEEYATEDVQYMEPLAEWMESQIKETRQQRAMQIENNAVFAIANMTVNGVQVDVPLWRESLKDWKQHKAKLYEELNELCPEVTKWGSPPQIKAAAKRLYGIDIPNTTFETVNILAPEFPMFALLKEFKHWKKLDDSWGDEYLKKHVYEDTSCIYPTWWQLNTGTGRMSCSNPNFQQIPRDTRTTKFRRLITAPPGHVVVALDYKQIEMLTAAIIAPDNVLLDLFRRGIDTHVYVGALVTGKAEADVNDDDRQIAKSANFGLLFGAGKATLSRYARKTYNIVIPEDDAAAIIRTYFGRFVGLAAMRRHAYDLFRDPPAAMVVRNLVGARRILAGDSLKPTTWLNTRIQSSAGYGLKAALRRLAEAGLTKYLRLQVHDECVFTFPINRLDELTAVAQECMIRGMQEVLGLSAPVQVDVHIGPTWEEIKAAA